MRLLPWSEADRQTMAISSAIHTEEEAAKNTIQRNSLVAALP
jgi:hypothetical protein